MITRLRKEEVSYQSVPVIRYVEQAMVQRNYAQTKQDIRHIIDLEIHRISNDPALYKQIINKNATEGQVWISFGG